jgi:hypothetical protein
MSIAAQLHRDTGVGHCAQIRGHDRRRTAIEGEGTHRHALVPKREQRLESHHLLIGKLGDRIRSI